MSPLPRTHRLSVTKRAAFSIVEAVFATVLVAGLLVVALDTVGASAVAQQGLERRAIAHALALDLMSEVMSQDYRDPNETPSFGIEASEAGATRAAFDDLDDYRNWSASPPQTKQGAVLTQYQGWRRTVTLKRVDPSNYDLEKFSDTGIRRVTVTVLFQGDELFSLTALRFGSNMEIEIIPDVLPVEH